MTADGSSVEVELSEEQLKAVNATERAILVLASAGSGKTEVVARRVQRLMNDSDVTSGRVLALTYTIKAADELAARLRARTGQNIELVDTETLHGFAHGLLRRHGTKLGLPLEPELLTRDEDRTELLNIWRASQGREPLADPAAHLRTIDLLRAKLEPDDRVKEWQDALASVSALDYPALLTFARQLLNIRSTRRQLERIYSHVIVDEAQNLTPAQFDLLAALLRGPDVGSSPTAMFVGDDKQSIISFAGADPSLLLRFAQEFDALQIKLTANYRSARRISELASRIAGSLGNAKSQDRPVHAAAGAIKYVEASSEEEEGIIVRDWVFGLLQNGIPLEFLAPGEDVSIAPEQIAIVGRSSTVLNNAIAQMTQHNIAVSASGSASDWLESAAGKLANEIVSLKSADQHRSIHWQLSRLLAAEESEVNTIAGLSRTIANHADPTIRMVKRMLDAKDIEQFIEWLPDLAIPSAVDGAELSSWSADVDEFTRAWIAFTEVTTRDHLTWANFRLFCSRRQSGHEGPGIQAMTIHKSQGREFRAVAVVGMNDGQIPDFRSTEGEALRAELRAFYVAVTRSRRVLLLTRSTSRTTRYGRRTSSPSRFLQFLDPIESQRSFDGNNQSFT